VPVLVSSLPWKVMVLDVAAWAVDDCKTGISTVRETSKPAITRTACLHLTVLIPALKPKTPAARLPKTTKALTGLLNRSVSAFALNSSLPRGSLPVLSILFPFYEVLVFMTKTVFVCVSLVFVFSKGSYIISSVRICTIINVYKICIVFMVKIQGKMCSFCCIKYLFSCYPTYLQMRLAIHGVVKIDTGEITFFSFPQASSP